MKKYILLLVLLTTTAYGITSKDPRLIEKDMKEGNIKEYMNDNIPLIQNITMYVDNSNLVGVTKDECDNFIPRVVDGQVQNNNISPLDFLKCPAPKDGYTTGIKKINLTDGYVQCVISVENNPYNPIGYYNHNISNCQSHFVPDLSAAKLAQADLIEEFKAKIDEINETKGTLTQPTFSGESQTYLDKTDLLISGLVVDTDKINTENTLASRRIILNDGYTSLISNDSYLHDISTELDSYRATQEDNSDMIDDRIASIIDFYIKAIKISEDYYALIVVLIMISSAGFFFGRKILKKSEDINDYDSKLLYTLTILVGILLFVPVSSVDIQSENNGAQEEFAVLHSNFQELERLGYNVTKNWADDLAFAAINVEVGNMLSKAGIHGAEAIVQTQAALWIAQKKTAVYKNYLKECSDTFFIDRTKRFSGNPNNLFPTSENMYYATIIASGASEYKNFYNNAYDGGKGSVRKSGVVGYPDMTLSSCGDVFNKTLKLEFDIKKYENMLFTTNGNMDHEFGVIRSLVEDIYISYQKYGFPSVIKLVSVVLQNEMIKIKDEANKITQTIDDETSFSRDVTKELSYLLVPGGQTIYSAIKDNATALLAAVGTGGAGWVGTIAGAITGALSSSVVAGVITIFFSKSLLAVLPLAGLTSFGILRLVIIMSKIFIFHFGSLFVLPLLFLSNNTEKMKEFAVKVGTTMLEIPIFVLAMWMALLVRDLFERFASELNSSTFLSLYIQNNNSVSHSSDSNHSWFDSLTNEMIIGLMEGLTEIAISLFTLILIYKIIITLHSQIFELLTIRINDTLDNSTETIHRESQGWGGRI